MPTQLKNVKRVIWWRQQLLPPRELLPDTCSMLQVQPRGVDKACLYFGSSHRSALLHEIREAESGHDVSPQEGFLRGRRLLR